MYLLREMYLKGVAIYLGYNYLQLSVCEKGVMIGKISFNNLVVGEDEEQNDDLEDDGIDDDDDEYVNKMYNEPPFQK